MVFICSIVYKYVALTESEDFQVVMSPEQKDHYLVNPLLLAFILAASVAGSLAFAGLLALRHVKLSQNAGHWHD